MTVADLIKTLSALPPDELVLLNLNDGNDPLELAVQYYEDSWGVRIVLDVNDPRSAQVQETLAAGNED